MTYDEALNYIHSKLRFGSKPGLKRIKELCNKLDNPHNSLKFLHVAGTNGKGSVTVMAAAVLSKAGYRTGMYISPYITDFRERMSVGTECISKEQLAAITEKIMPLAESMDESPTEFELVSAIAFEYFKAMKCDIVVLETGLGGRFDATNIINTTLCSVITKISLDHTEYLGDTLSKIAFEKCGIIKPDRITISYPCQEDEAAKVISSRALQEGNTLILPDLHVLKVNSSSIEGLNIDYKGINIDISLAGSYQAHNCITALEAVFALREHYGFEISDTDIKSGISAVKFPARLEILSKSPLIILDGAHNLDGIRSLTKYMDDYLSGCNIHCIMGMLKDKDYGNSIDLIASKCKSLCAVKPDNVRALPAKELADIARLYCKDVSFCESYEKAIEQSTKKAGKDDAILICGSLYMAGKMRGIVRKS